VFYHASREREGTLDRQDLQPSRAPPWPAAYPEHRQRAARATV